MPILKRITETVEGEEITMEEQVYVVEVSNGGQKYWLKGTIFASAIDRADGFETIDAAAAAIQKAEKFMTPAIRKKLVVKPYGGDLVAA
ncbi:hypothetical protein FIU28_17475 [Tardiphaga sp. vice154]|uniref:hypothetical protein n=1 Tax=Tardiphaga sp. vice154 TaxID=2592814 RepID=UPI001162FAD1|nr:hypothetical protein [Tardiphaga sp. vice154]QDM22743.1 hypothetical protein FIU28_17475 [Tardiphaga sp. vice154]